MSTRGLLLFGVVFLLMAWIASTTGLIRQAPRFLRLLVTGLFMLAAIRVGLSIAIIAFDLSPISLLIPISLGILAWWFRPGRNLSP